MTPGAAGLRTRRELAAALEQQMWFFGCDAACADGNLLTRYGFERCSSAQRRGKSSRYRFLWSTTDGRGPGAEVHLHGWHAGLHATPADAAPGGFLYLRGGSRLGWYEAPAPIEPGACDDDPAARWAFCSLGRCPEEGFRRHASLFLQWLEGYEAWIDAVCGPRYRARCHERAPLPSLPPTESRAWLAAYRAALAAVPASLPSTILSIHP